MGSGENLPKNVPFGGLRPPQRGLTSVAPPDAVASLRQELAHREKLAQLVSRIHAAKSLDTIFIELKQDMLFAAWMRSEEHTSELQSLAYLVCRLLLEKKKRSELGEVDVATGRT